MSDREKFLPRTFTELERMAGIRRTHRPSPTQDDIERMTRKMLGPSWGKKRAPRR